MKVLLALGLSDADLSNSHFHYVMADKSTPLLGVVESDVRANCEGVSTTLSILFSSDVEGLLVAWHDYIALGSLPEDYPRPLKSSPGRSV